MVDLVNEQVGAETNLKVVYEEKKLKIEVVYDGKQADANLVVIVEPGVLLDALKSAIPGNVDDAVIDALKAAFV
jgi:hypothetical protein